MVFIFLPFGPGREVPEQGTVGIAQRHALLPVVGAVFLRASGVEFRDSPESAHRDQVEARLVFLKVTLRPGLVRRTRSAVVGDKTSVSRNRPPVAQCRLSRLVQCVGRQIYICPFPLVHHSSLALRP